MKRLLQRLKVWLLKDAGVRAQRCNAMKPKRLEFWDKVVLAVIICTVSLLWGVLILGASAPKPKLSAADQRAMSKIYRVPCLDCSELSPYGSRIIGAFEYRLKPVRVTQGVGNRSVTNGFMQEIILHFRCPVRHEFSAPGPERFIPAIRAEEER